MKSGDRAAWHITKMRSNQSRPMFILSGSESLLPLCGMSRLTNSAFGILLAIELKELK